MTDFLWQDHMYCVNYDFDGVMPIGRGKEIGVTSYTICFVQSSTNSIYSLRLE